MEMTEHQMTDAKPLDGYWYQTYSPGTRTHEARAAFVRKYGYEPEMVFAFHRLVWAGPVVEREEAER